LLSRVDATVDFKWAGGSPATDIPSDGFSARWTGEVEARSTETYTFYITHDDGARVWVNDVQVINNWTDHAAVEDSGTIKLEMGKKYSIVVEFYENSGDASCQVFWSTTTIAKEIIPQSQLYNSTTPTSTVTPTATATLRPTVTPTASATAAPSVTPSPSASVTVGEFAVSYTQFDWGSGATVSVTIKNNGTNAVDGWKLAFDFAGNQKISNLWSGTFTQNGTTVTISNASYNGTIPAGGSVSFGFNLNYSGTNTQPSGFTVNGSAATIN
jgi:hypothetical protein